MSSVNHKALKSPTGAASLPLRTQGPGIPVSTRDNGKRMQSKVPQSASLGLNPGRPQTASLQRSKRPQKRRQNPRKGAKARSRKDPLGTIYETPVLQSEAKRKTRKRYRRTKVLRLWVLPVLFLIPLSIAWVEFSIGKLIGLDDVKEVYKEQLSDPWDRLNEDLDALWSPSKDHPPSIVANVSYTPHRQCPNGQRGMINAHNPISHSHGHRKIPMIVHQQSKTRCLTLKVDKTTFKWAFRRWSYYIHDEESKDRLFDRYCGDITKKKCEFPLLRQIVSNCLAPSNDTMTRYDRQRYFLKVELWKFLTLWKFGGLYIDIGYLPDKFAPTTLQNDDDAYLLIDPETEMLSTKLMATSPRHPVFYYAIQYLLQNIFMEESPLLLQVPEDLMITNPDTIGSVVLQHAFQMFRSSEHRNEQDVLTPGLFHGALNRTIRLVNGSGLNVGRSEGGLVKSIFETEEERAAEFRKIGWPMMLNPNDDATANPNGGDTGNDFTCLEKLYRHTST